VTDKVTGAMTKKQARSKRRTDKKRVREAVGFLGGLKLVNARDVWAWLLLIAVSAISIIGEAVGLFHQGIGHYLYIVACSAAGLFGFIGLFSWLSQAAARVSESLRYSNMVAATDELFAVLELKRPDYKNHWKAASRVARMISEQMNLPDTEVETVSRAAEVMDIGLVDLIDEIGREPADSATQRLIESHTSISETILAGIYAEWAILPMVRSHHERYDGMGYPDALKGDDIPMGSRILAVADAFVAMCSIRPYRDSRTIDEAISELKDNSEKQFDPRVVEALIVLVNVEDEKSFTNIRSIVLE